MDSLGRKTLRRMALLIVLTVGGLCALAQGIPGSGPNVTENVGSINVGSSGTGTVALGTISSSGTLNITGFSTIAFNNGNITLAAGGSFTSLAAGGNVAVGNSRINYGYSDSSGTPGAATINLASGRAAVANAASSVVITDSQVTATTIVHTQLETTACGIDALVVVPASGSFTVSTMKSGAVTATTAACKFSFVISNA